MVDQNTGVRSYLNTMDNLQVSYSGSCDLQFDQGGHEFVIPGHQAQNGRAMTLGGLQADNIPFYSLSLMMSNGPQTTKHLKKMTATAISTTF